MSAQPAPVIATTFRGEEVWGRATIRDVHDFLPEYRREAFTAVLETTPAGNLMALFVDGVWEATGDERGRVGRTPAIWAVQGSLSCGRNA
ncbi:hypothetical protein AB0A70_20120 [Streptomyces morookaense]|uniref:hypothetical protein n=1 Tax=Streptomyces morookaense TaxID=1970 RepID=UPI0033C775FE